MAYRKNVFMFMAYKCTCRYISLYDIFNYTSLLGPLKQVKILYMCHLIYQLSSGWHCKSIDTFEKYQILGCLKVSFTALWSAFVLLTKMSGGIYETGML